MNNTEAVLALISELYATTVKLAAENAELRAALVRAESEAGNKNAE